LVNIVVFDADMPYFKNMAYLAKNNQLNDLGNL